MRQIGKGGSLPAAREQQAQPHAREACVLRVADRARLASRQGELQRAVVRSIAPSELYRGERGGSKPFNLCVCVVCERAYVRGAWWGGALMAGALVREKRGDAQGAGRETCRHARAASGSEASGKSPEMSAAERAAAK